MGACRFCGCSSWLFGLSVAGLCGNCEHLVSAEVEERLKVLAGSLGDAEATHNPRTKLERLGLAVVQLEALAAHERKGIPTTLVSVERRLQDTERQRAALLARTVKQDLDETMRAVRGQGDPELKAKLLLGFRLRLVELSAGARVKGPLPALEKKISHAVWRVRLDASLARARREERGGGLAAAGRAYREALTLLGSPDAGGQAALELRMRVVERLDALDAGRTA